MSKITLKVNGRTHTRGCRSGHAAALYPAQRPRPAGPRFGCGLGQCGACTVIINGAAVRSCILPASSVKARNHHARRARVERQAAPAAAGLDRRAGAAMRILPERTDPDREGDARQESASDRRADPRGHERNAVPLHDVLPRSGGHQARGQDDRRCLARFAGRRWWHEHLYAEFRNRSKIVLVTHRRGFLQKRGTARGELRAALRRRARRAWPRAAGTRPLSRSRFPPARLVDRHSPEQHGHVLRRQDRPRPGHRHGFRQLMSDELDIAFDKTTCIMGSTDITVDQGGSGGSDRDGDAIRWPMRRVAAEARRVLLEMASTRLGVPVDQLAVSDARHHRESRPVEARHLRRADRRKEIQRHADRRQHQRDHRPGQIKTVQELKYAGQSPQRDDIPAKVDGSLKWAVDVKLPGMVHARNVKPPFAGAKLTGIDESSVEEPAGLRQGGAAKATTSPWCASAKSRPSAPPASSRRPGRSRRPRRSRRPTISSTTCAAATPTSASAGPIVAGDPDAAFRERGKDHRGRVRGAVPGTHRVRRRARHGRSRRTVR